MSLQISAPFNSNPKNMPHHRHHPTPRLSARKDEVDPPEDDAPYAPMGDIEPYSSDDGPLYLVEEEKGEPAYPQEGGYPATTNVIAESPDAMNHLYVLGAVLLAAVIYLIVTVNQNCGKIGDNTKARGAFRGSDVASEEVIQRMLNF
jgi:hypothetical protein